MFVSIFWYKTHTTIESSIASEQSCWSIVPWLVCTFCQLTLHWSLSSFPVYPQVVNCKVGTNKSQKDAGLFSLVTLETVADASFCISQLHQTKYNGSWIEVKKVCFVSLNNIKSFIVWLINTSVGGLAWKGGSIKSDPNEYPVLLIASSFEEAW